MTEILLCLLRVFEMDELLHDLCDIASSIRLQIPCKPLEAQPLTGSSHSIHIIHFVDGIEWMARTPKQSERLPMVAVNGDDVARFASEVSTLQWLRYNTSVKAPKLYAWSIPNTRCTAVCDGMSQLHRATVKARPWMLMEKLNGDPLTYEIWDDLKDDQREKVREQGMPSDLIRPRSQNSYNFFYLRPYY